jgi:hypothetical protein
MALDELEEHVKDCDDCIEHDTAGKYTLCPTGQAIAERLGEPGVEALFGPDEDE